MAFGGHRCGGCAAFGGAHAAAIVSARVGAVIVIGVAARIVKAPKAKVARIRRRIAWNDGMETSDRAFLTAYYAALRARLERQVLFGRRRKDKFDRG